MSNDAILDLAMRAEWGRRSIRFELEAAPIVLRRGDEHQPVSDLLARQPMTVIIHGAKP